MKQYLVKFIYIDTGKESEAVEDISHEETRDVIDVIKERWKGLLCSSNGMGLRSILSITDIS